MINRDKAIEILEGWDNTWVYEDMEDEELISKIAMVTGCSSKKQEETGDCRSITCRACWERTLSI